MGSWKLFIVLWSINTQDCKKCYILLSKKILYLLYHLTLQYNQYPRFYFYIQQQGCQCLTQLMNTTQTRHGFLRVSVGHLTHLIREDFWCLVCQMPNIWHLAHLMVMLLEIIVLDQSRPLHHINGILTFFNQGFCLQL